MIASSPPIFGKPPNKMEHRKFQVLNQVWRPTPLRPANVLKQELREPKYLGSHLNHLSSHKAGIIRSSYGMTIPSPSWLVVGCHPSEKWWSSSIKGWFFRNPIYFWENKELMATSPHQPATKSAIYLDQGTPRVDLNAPEGKIAKIGVQVPVDPPTKNRNRSNPEHLCTAVVCFWKALKSWWGDFIIYRYH